MIKILKKLLADPALTYIETLQNLWSGYGEISRYYSPQRNASLIVKSVEPPENIEHPRGWHSTTGHERKLASYKIEACFYQSYAQLCLSDCSVPQMIAFSEHQLTESAQVLVMEDLLQLGFDDNESNLSLQDIQVVIRWLAFFHARFLGNPANGLWPIGTYWHLATRQDEYNKMQQGRLKQAAEFIDNTLNNAQYQTIVHGDAKLANFCFGEFPCSTDSLTSLGLKRLEKIKRVAAVDFQYVGKGVGVKDLAYFLGSCLSDNDLIQLHDSLLDYYFQVLAEACLQYQPNINVNALEKEWRYLYAFSCADFHRFLQGWSPEHYKINPYLQSQTEIALKHFIE